MYQILKKNWDKTKYLLLSGIAISALLLLVVVYQKDDKKVEYSGPAKNTIETEDLKLFAEFLLKQIKSPFTNVSYKVKKGDTLVSILKNYKINNRDINKAITEFKKYNKSSNITSGLKINLTTKNEMRTTK